MKVHGGGVASGKHQSRADAPGWADGAEDICRAGSLILGGRGACSPFRPAPRDFVLLADPGLILPPDFYDRSDREPAPDLRHLGGEFFLNASPASGSWAW